MPRRPRMGCEVLNSVSDEILRGFIEHLGDGHASTSKCRRDSGRARKMSAHLAELAGYERKASVRPWPTDWPGARHQRVRRRLISGRTSSLGGNDSCREAVG